MKPYRFANGVLLPKGTMVGAPVGGIHMDDKIYKNAKEFDGFRFSKLREQYGDNPKYYSANTGYDYLHFGHGQRAWFCRLHDRLLILAPEGFSQSMRLN